MGKGISRRKCKATEGRTKRKGEKRAPLEAEAASLKRRAKRLTEEEEQLDRESKYSLGSEKSSESGNLTREAEKKLEEAKALG